MSSWSGTPSRFTPSSSAVSPQRSSDSVKTSFAFLKLPSSCASCCTVSTMTRLISSASVAGTVENAAVRSTSAIGPDRQNIGVRLRRVRPDGKADRLTQLVLARSRCPGTCQVALRSVGVADGEVGREITKERRLRIQCALFVLPTRDDVLFEHHHDSLPLAKFSVAYFSSRGYWIMGTSTTGSTASGHEVLRNVDH